MSDSFQPGRRVTVAEAAVILGVSLSRVRQLIHDGILKAEKIRRNSGTAYMIDLDAAPKSVLPSLREDRQSREALCSGEMVPTQVMDHVVDRLLERIAGQAETIGQLRAELTALRAPTVRPHPER